LIFYDGTYRLRNTDECCKRLVGKWSACWRVRIIDLSMSQPEVTHLRPVVVVATQTGEGIFKTTCAESLGKKICRDFNLDVRNILWIEPLPGEADKICVAVFTPKFYFGHEKFYFIRWRPILPNELKMILPFIPELSGVPVP